MAALDKPSDVYGAGDGAEWRRRVAIAVNWLLGPLTRRVTALEAADVAFAAADTALDGRVDTLEATDAARLTHPFQPLATAPASPTAGQAYYDTATNKARVYDGTAWNDLF